MKKKTKKILAAALVSSMLISSIGAAPVFAASSASGNLNGINCSGLVRYTTNSSGTNNGVNVVTSFAGTATIIKATATAYYNYRGTITPTKSVTNYSTAGGTSATASADGLGTVCGGKGEHYVKYGDYKWEPTTTIGSLS